MTRVAARSFEDLRTHTGTLYDTFREAAEARGHAPQLVLVRKEDAQLGEVADLFGQLAQLVGRNVELE